VVFIVLETVERRDIKMQLLGSYVNGNYQVDIYNDGTKIRATLNENDTCFKAQFPESMDVKITNFCDMGCEWCHENSTIQGLHGNILNAKFIDSLRPYTEIALGGGNPLSHPQLVEFLQVLKEKKIIANMTVNQKHFMSNRKLIEKLVDEKLIYGLGISFTSYDEELIKSVRQFPNAVLHVINGIVSLNDVEKMYDKNLKILILGYKMFRRGSNFYSELVENKKKEMFDKLPEVLEHFNVVSFDNLALKQLDVKRLLSEDEWNEFYMGSDGSHTMYIDLVDQNFALNSTSHIAFALRDTIDEMFAVVNTKSQ
jgi:hypothetical protein